MRASPANARLARYGLAHGYFPRLAYDRRRCFCNCDRRDFPPGGLSGRRLPRPPVRQRQRPDPRQPNHQRPGCPALTSRVSQLGKSSYASPTAINIHSGVCSRIFRHGADQSDCIGARARQARRSACGARCTEGRSCRSQASSSATGATSCRACSRNCATRSAATAGSRAARSATTTGSRTTHSATATGSRTTRPTTAAPGSSPAIRAKAGRERPTPPGCCDHAERSARVESAGNRSATSRGAPASFCGPWGATHLAQPAQCSARHW